MHREIRDFIEASVLVTEPRSIEFMMGSTLHSLGFDGFAYRSVEPSRKSRVIVFTDYESGWAEHYLERRYSDIDPVISTARRAVLPFDWKTAPDVRQATGSQRAIFHEACEFGIRNGATFPIHGPMGQFATLTATTKLSEREFDRLFDRHQYDLQLIGLYAHAAMARITGETTRPPKLTPREREVLLWTAQGKTAWEIGKVLAISERTAVFHLTNVRFKLRVYSKIHAVVKAIMLGLISP